MEIITKKLTEIRPYEKNPRKNDEAAKYVANSIKEFGFKVPIIIDKDGIIVCGHTRYKAAKKLGMKEVPCIMADDLTPEQIKAFRLADNKVGEMAEWDLDLLMEELDGIGMDMETFGFVDTKTEEELPPKETNDSLIENLPESRIMVCSISVFGTQSEVFIETKLPQETANHILNDLFKMDPEKISEKMVGVLNDL